MSPVSLQADASIAPRSQITRTSLSMHSAIAKKTFSTCIIVRRSSSWNVVAVKMQKISALTHHPQLILSCVCIFTNTLHVWHGTKGILLRHMLHYELLIVFNAPMQYSACMKVDTAILTTSKCPFGCGHGNNNMPNKTKPFTYTK